MLSHLYRFDHLSTSKYTVYFPMTAILGEMLLMVPLFDLGTTVLARHHAVAALVFKVMLYFFEHKQPHITLSWTFYNSIDAFVTVESNFRSV